MTTYVSAKTSIPLSGGGGLALTFQGVDKARESVAAWFII